MRKKIVFLSLLLVVPMAAVAQMVTCETNYDGPGKMVPGSPSPIFELNKPFEHPIALPNDVLAVLRADPSIARKFEANCSRENLSQMPPEWFLATEIKWADDKLPGLIVNPANSCLWNKDGEKEVADFWIFQQVPAGYQPAFTFRTQALQVLNTRTNGHPDVCTILRHDPFTFSQTVYTFQQGRYQPRIDRGVNVDPPPR